MFYIILGALIKTNQLLTSGIAVTAFSLLLYALTFNLKDRVARSFALILACMATVATGDTLASVLTDPGQIGFSLHLQWVGIIFLPAAYFYSSDALLATTGLPSRGRRRLVNRLAFLTSFGFILFLLTDHLNGAVVPSLTAAPYLERTPLTFVFIFYYAFMAVWSWVNYWRAYRRMTTRAGKRRLLYLMAGATAPAVGSFPFILFGADVAANHHLIFWTTVVVTNVLTTILLVLMAYAMAFFGADLPDRIIRSRLYRWLMRGPVTVLMVLSATTFVRTMERRMGNTTTTIAEILVMVGMMLVMQYVITLTSPWVERNWILQGDSSALEPLQNLESRLLTRADLLQFLEAVLASACDSLQTESGFVAGITPDGPETLVTIGKTPRLLKQDDALVQSTPQEAIFPWQDYWLIPLRSANGGEQQPALLGFLAIGRPNHGNDPSQLPPEQDREDLLLLAGRAAQALENNSIQQRLFSAMQELTPRVEAIQRLRAASRYDGSTILSTSSTATTVSPEIVKDTLDHFWGGPKFTQSPLLGTHLVQKAIREGENQQNALRNILRQVIEQTRPPGERRWTTDWMIYNILAMKYVEGHKVRDIASRLAISEADFYRKQRAAIQAAATILAEMENQSTRTTHSQAEGDREIT